MVFRANHAKLLAESDALVDQAKDLINEFYAAMQDGFNNGDMIGCLCATPRLTTGFGVRLTLRNAPWCVMRLWLLLMLC
ncbi:hypothetical protein CEP82_012020 [Mobiluncus mulieris]|nr:hypothetical protein CEP82_012020 [Mobiluncus mulieris]